MSEDDIVFGDVSYREPQRLRRPDLDRRFACIAYELPGPDDMPIFLNLATADAIERHALRDTSVELGGILLGQECIDEETGKPFVWVTQSLEAKHYENTQSSFTYTHDSWEEITRERDQRFPDLDIVGWYHTHPDFGIFLSSHDQFIHRNFFAQPLQVAYVVDPIRQTRGFFQWRDDHLDQVGGFYLMSDRADRQALARFVNDLEQIPNSGGGPGGLSPRLEAELIAMLARPAYAPVAVDRSQTAAMFTMIGAVLGVAGLSAVLWLNTLVAQLRDQNQAIKDLEKSVAKAEEKNKEEVNLARVQAKEVALDDLLKEARAGATPERFAALYAQARTELDQTKGDLRKQVVSSNAVFERNENLEKELKVTKEKLEEVQQKADRATELEDRNAELKTQLEDTKSRLWEKDGYRKYTYAWYAAVAGWVACLGLGLALSMVYARPEPEPQAEPIRQAEPPHTIL